MSLLHVENEKTQRLAIQVFERHFQTDPILGTEYDDRRKRLMFQDIQYNLAYLDIAIKYDDDKIMAEYGVWIYQLLCYVMKDLSRERIRDHMVTHYRLLQDAMGEMVGGEEGDAAVRHLENAILATEAESRKPQGSDRFENGKYVEINKKYLDLMLKNDTRSAIQTIQEAAASGIKLPEIYMDILQEVMVEVGNLWHKNVITVDREHYCTTTTQSALTHFYPEIFSKPRNGYRVLTCCVGSELHEMGIRMVSDLFEYRGWDSIYLGAAVPKDAVLNAIRENQPDLVALSVTMPLHLPICHELVEAIREEFGDLKIAVGGRAFQFTNQLWKKWNIDVYAENAKQTVDWAEEHISNTGGIAS